MNQNPEEVQVLNFVNEARIQKKKLKIRSFNLFHLCQYKCVQNIKNQESQSCFKRCEIDLDEFIKYKQSTGGNEFKDMFWAIPADNPEAVKKYGLTDEEIQNYQKKCIQMETKWKDRLDNISSYLDQWEQKLKSKK